MNDKPSNDMPSPAERAWRSLKKADNETLLHHAASSDQLLASISRLILDLKQGSSQTATAQPIGEFRDKRYYIGK